MSTKRPASWRRWAKRGIRWKFAKPTSSPCAPPSARSRRGRRCSATTGSGRPTAATRGRSRPDSMPLNPEASLRAVPSRRFFAELSIRAYLMLLIAAVLVPMLVLAGVLAWHYGDAERRTIEAQRVDVANNLVHLLDRDVEAMAGFLGGISLAPGLQAGDPEVLRAAT